MPALSGKLIQLVQTLKRLVGHLDCKQVDISYNEAILKILQIALLLLDYDRKHLGTGRGGILLTAGRIEGVPQWYWSSKNYAFRGTQNCTVS